MLLQVGPLITKMSGSIAGLTVQDSAGGLTGRSKPVPRVRRTAYTNSERGMSQYLSRRWRALSPAALLLWQTAADGITWTNRFGETIKGQGYWLFLRCNLNRLLAGASVIEAAPAVTPTGVITGLSASVNIAGGTFSISWTSVPVPVGETWIVFATPPLSRGVASGGTAFRFITRVAALTASPVAIQVPYNVRHIQLPTSAQRVFVRVRPIILATGIAGNRYDALATIS